MPCPPSLQPTTCFHCLVTPPPPMLSLSCHPQCFQCLLHSNWLEGFGAFSQSSGFRVILRVACHHFPFFKLLCTVNQSSLRDCGGGSVPRRLSIRPRPPQPHDVAGPAMDAGNPPQRVPVAKGFGPRWPLWRRFPRVGRRVSF